MSDKLENAPKDATAANYLDNYKILSDAAKELREQEVVDIDRLVPLVDRALTAYNVCKARIDSVQRLLAEKLGDEEVEKID